MYNRVIVIGGYLASGKSTFALQLSKVAGVPYLIKDTFKSALCENITINDRKERSKFSAITFDAMMYVAERLFEKGYPLILEGNFVPGGVKKTDEAAVLRKLIEKYEYESLTYQFRGDTRVLHRRFMEREITPERGQANVIGEEVSFEDFDTWCRNLDGFDIGGQTVRVDTTNFDQVNFQKLLEIGAGFLTGKY